MFTNNLMRDRNVKNPPSFKLILSRNLQAGLPTLASDEFWNISFIPTVYMWSAILLTTFLHQLSSYRQCA